MLEAHARSLIAEKVEDLEVQEEGKPLLLNSDVVDVASARNTPPTEHKDEEHILLIDENQESSSRVSKALMIEPEEEEAIVT